MSRARRIMYSYFQYLCLVLAVLAVVVLLIGSWFGNILVMIVGSVLLSTMITSWILESFSIAVSLPLVLQEMIIEKGFLGRLSENELKELIEKCLLALRRDRPSLETFGAVEKQLLDKVGGVVHKYRSYTITLEPCSKYGKNLSRAQITTSAIYANESSESRSLFENDILTHGFANPILPKIPEDAREIFSFKQLKINDKTVHPKVNIDWVDPSDPTKGIRHEIEYRQRINPLEEVHVSLTTDMILSENDYIIRRFTGFTSGGIEVAVNHPPDLNISLIWFVRDLILHRAIESSTTLVQRADGVSVPGDGFVVILQPKRKEE